MSNHLSVASHHRCSFPQRVLVVAALLLLGAAASASARALSSEEGGRATMRAAPKDASTGLIMSGSVSASWGPSGVKIKVGTISNTRASGFSRQLRLVLWASSALPVFGQVIYAFDLGKFNLGTLQAGYQFTNVDTGIVAYTPPPDGCYYVTVALEEYDGANYPYVDFVILDSGTGSVSDGAGHVRFAFGSASCTVTACTRDAQTACLQGGRMEVKVAYTTATATGSGQVMYFGGQRAESNDSVFLWFFGATNFEMGLKILNACAVNGHFWVFISGLTDQGWTVDIRDTQTGATARYSNRLGHLTSTTADTLALPCP